MRHSYSARSNKGRGFAKSRRGSNGIYDVAIEIVSEIRAVGKVKDLEDGLNVGPLFDLEVLSNSRVKLEERLSAGIVKGSD